MAKKSPAEKEDRRELLLALGRLRDDQKRVFVGTACEWLSALSKRKAGWSPREEHYLALAALIKQSLQLVRALEGVERSGIPESYMREAWESAAHMRNTPDAPFPLDLPTTLRCLALAAQIRMPDPRPSHRPRGSTIETFLVRLLAAEFKATFLKPATVGTNSPFAKFCAADLVAKRAGSAYVARRSQDWWKVKTPAGIERERQRFDRV